MPAVASCEGGLNAGILPRMTDIWPAAEHAADMVEPDMVVGLGTGRAAVMFVRARARRVQDGLAIRGIPTSLKTAELAKELSVPVTTLDEIKDIGIDIDVDGADEVDPTLIKGHGGALLRERVVASVSKLFVVLVGEEKLVPHLGAKMAVPVEVVPFAVPVVRAGLVGLAPTWRSALTLTVLSSPTTATRSSMRDSTKSPTPAISNVASTSSQASSTVGSSSAWPISCSCTTAIAFAPWSGDKP